MSSIILVSIPALTRILKLFTCGFAWCLVLFLNDDIPPPRSSLSHVNASGEGYLKMYLLWILLFSPLYMYSFYQYIKQIDATYLSYRHFSHQQSPIITITPVVVALLNLLVSACFFLPPGNPFILSLIDQELRIWLFARHINASYNVNNYSNNNNNSNNLLDNFNNDINNGLLFGSNLYVCCKWWFAISTVDSLLYLLDYSQLFDKTATISTLFTTPPSLSSPSSSSSSLPIPATAATLASREASKIMCAEFNCRTILNLLSSKALGLYQFIVIYNLTLVNLVLSLCKLFTSYKSFFDLLVYRDFISQCARECSYIKLILFTGLFDSMYTLGSMLIFYNDIVPGIFFDKAQALATSSTSSSTSSSSELYPKVSHNIATKSTTGYYQQLDRHLSSSVSLYSTSSTSTNGYSRATEDDEEEDETLLSSTFISTNSNYNSTKHSIRCESRQSEQIDSNPDGSAVHVLDRKIDSTPRASFKLLTTDIISIALNYFVYVNLYYSFFVNSSNSSSNSSCELFFSSTAYYCYAASVVWIGYVSIRWTLAAVTALYRYSCRC